MNPVVLLAELIAHGLDPEVRNGVVYYVGDRRHVAPSLQAELDTHWRELEAYLLDDREGHHAR